MEQRGWLIAIAASATIASLGCVTHPPPARALRLANVAETETGPPVPTNKPQEDKARVGWLKRKLPGIYTMPWYSKVGFTSIAVYLIYAFAHHEGGGGSSGTGPLCPFPQQWNGRDGRCEGSIFSDVH